MAILIIGILQLLFKALYLLIFLWWIMTWFPSMRWSPFGRLIFSLSEPLLQPFRKFVGMVRIGKYYLDLSPLALLLVAWIIVEVLKRIIVAIFLR